MALPDTVCVFGYTGTYDATSGNEIKLNNLRSDGPKRRSMTVEYGSQKLSFPEYAIASATDSWQTSVFNKEWQPITYSYSGSLVSNGVRLDVTDILQEYTLEGTYPHDTYRLKDIYCKTGDSSSDPTRGFGYCSGHDPEWIYTLADFEQEGYTVFDPDWPYVGLDTGDCVDIVPIYERVMTRKLRVNSVRTDGGPDLSSLGINFTISMTHNGQSQTINPNEDIYIDNDNNPVTLVFMSTASPGIIGAYGIEFLGWYLGDTLIEESSICEIHPGSVGTPDDPVVTAKYTLSCKLNCIANYSEGSSVVVYNDGNILTPTSPALMLPYGSEIQVIANAASGYFFAGWSNAPAGWPNLDDITVNLIEPLDFAAIFGASPSGQIIKIL